MSCLATAGYSPTDCGKSAPGVYKEGIWIFNRAEIDAYVSTVTGEVSGITLTGVATGFKLDIEKGTGNIISELATAAKSGNVWNQTFTAFFAVDETELRNFIEDNQYSDLVFVIRKKNGKYIIGGEEEGMRLATDIDDSGTIAGDDSGVTLTFVAENTIRPRYFFDTDEATTLATLDSYL